MEWYLLSFSITIALELLCGIFLGYRSRKDMMAIIGVNAVTHPTLHFFGPIGLTEYLVVEALVVGVEYVLLCYVWKRSLWSGDVALLAVSMNTLSFVAGEIVLK